MFTRNKQFFAEMLKVGRLKAELAELYQPREARKTLLAQIRRVSENVDCPYNESHVLEFIVALFSLPSLVDGAIVEAGCYKGGSTAKLSLVASILGRQMVVFDSFQGLPTNAESHEKSILGHSIQGWFAGGKFSAGLAEVRSNIAQFGDLAACQFVEGWFDDTMPLFGEPIAAAYLDVDLASSTQTCLKYLYPLLSPGGLIMSQDGDFPLVIDVFKDREFWEDEVGWPMPVVEGLGTQKILTLMKPLEAVPLRKPENANA